jgi:hypothetical protein
MLHIGCLLACLLWALLYISSSSPIRSVGGNGVAGVDIVLYYMTAFYVVVGLTLVRARWRRRVWMLRIGWE